MIGKGDAGLARRESRNISSRNLSVNHDLRLGVSWVKWSEKAFLVEGVVRRDAEGWRARDNKANKAKYRANPGTKPVVEDLTFRLGNLTIFAASSNDGELESFES